MAGLENVTRGGGRFFVGLGVDCLLPGCRLLAVLVVYFTVQGVYSSGVMEKHWGEDPSRVVVDEMVGVWIPLLVVPDGGWWYVVAAFVLFRFFDIVKPLGVRRMERLGGGMGIMMDDILAGVYSAVLLGAARFLIG